MKTTALAVGLSALLFAGCARAPLVWTPLDAADFSARLPGEAKLETSTQETAAGPVGMRNFGVESGNSFYSVSIADYPAGVMEKAVPATVLAGGRNGAIGAGTLYSDKEVSLDSGPGMTVWPGREFHGLTVSGLRLTSRMYLVGSRLYQLILVSPVGEFSQAEFLSFANSFKLKSPTPAAAP